MRVVLAGATGLIGRRLLPLLADAGHSVTALTRDARRAEALAGPEVDVVECDVYDSVRLARVMADAAPEVVISQLTDLPDDARQVAEFEEANARIRRVGVVNLLAAGHAAGCHRFLAQSVAWDIGGDGAAAVADMERAVLDAGGVVLRYGRFHGPGTYYEMRLPPTPRVHLDHAAARTIEMLHHPSGVVTIVDAGDDEDDVSA
jgi:uncharacterized protein YbjT (DUF2867 family)